MRLVANARFLAAVVLLALVVTLTTAGAAPRLPCVLWWCERIPADGGSSVAVLDPGPQPLQIRGRVAKPLSPGAGARLDLVLINRNRFPVSASRLRVWLSVASAPRATAQRTCSATDFDVVPAAPLLRVRVPREGRTTLSRAGIPRVAWPRVQMLNRPVNQNGCKGARLTLRFTAVARQARR